MCAIKCSYVFINDTPWSRHVNHIGIASYCICIRFVRVCLVFIALTYFGKSREENAYDLHLLAARSMGIWSGNKCHISSTMISLCPMGMGEIMDNLSSRELMMICHVFELWVEPKIDQRVESDDLFIHNSIKCCLMLRYAHAIYTSASCVAFICTWKLARNTSISMKWNAILSLSFSHCLRARAKTFNLNMKLK